jgi:hypothetical protein
MDFRLVRFNTDGTLDASFGATGVVTLDVYAHDHSYRTLIQTDPACNCEKIVMSGGSDPQISFAAVYDVLKSWALFSPTIFLSLCPVPI